MRPAVLAVIGRGLIGAAAARHLAKAGHEVTLIGPGEPADPARHAGVFASHYDEGRITRALDPNPFWSRVSRAAIARYPEIAAESGIAFHTPVGAVLAGTEGAPFDTGAAEVVAAGGVPSTRLSAEALRARFPFFHVPDDWIGYAETGAAGHISPRRLVAAQTRAAERAGARVIDAEARGLDVDAAGVRIATDAGEVRADRVLVAAGGFSHMLLPELPMRVMARTIAFLEVDDAEAARLAAMPALISYDHGRDTYMLPPIRYPDGRLLLKIGGDPVDRTLPDADATADWFRSGGAVAVGAVLEAEMRARLPGLAVRSVQTGACVTSFTPADLPVIDRRDDRIAVATAGCGRGAKCSDELGRLGAEALLGRCDPALSLEAVAAAA